MYYLKRCLVFILLFAACKSSFAQNRNIQLTPAIKAEVVDSLSSALLKKYIYLDTAVKMSDRIRTSLKNGHFKFLNNPDDFAQSLNADLNAVYRDLHMRIYYDPDFETVLRTKSYMASVTRRMQFLVSAKQKNFGFAQAKILDGNVGYVSITQFYDVNDESVAALKSVFSFLKNANALIIDVRDNPGGEPEMVQYISSYFFKDRTHLNDFYDRHTRTNEYWTNPLPESAVFSLVPLFVLVNNHTYSAAEEFAYDLQGQHRATIVGQTTGGAAHWVSSNSLGNGFIGNIPFRKAVNPVTHTNWEKTGVKPNVTTSDENAVDAALLGSFDRLINTSNDSTVVKQVKWFRGFVNARLHPFTPDIARLKTYIGNYTGRRITLEKGQLYFTDSNGYRIRLTQLSATTFAFINNDRHVEFVKSGKGKVVAMNFIYADGRVECKPKSGLSRVKRMEQK